MNTENTHYTRDELEATGLEGFARSPEDREESVRAHGAEIATRLELARAEAVDEVPSPAKWTEYATTALAFLDPPAVRGLEPVEVPLDVAQNPRALRDLLADLEVGGYAVVEQANGQPKVIARSETTGDLVVRAFLPVGLNVLDFPVRVLAFRERKTSLLAGPA